MQRFNDEGSNTYSITWRGVLMATMSESVACVAAENWNFAVGSQRQSPLMTPIAALYQRREQIA